MLVLIFLFLVSFFVGAIPTGYVIGRIYGIDIREHGSGNIGAANARRLLGKKAGSLTFFGDAGKGLLAASLPFLAGQEGSDALSPLTATLALVGHCYSPFLHFKGGKGVATGCGGFLYLATIPTTFACIVFIITRKISGYVSVGSVVAALSFATLILLNVGQPTNWQTKTAALVCTVIIMIRHQDNFKRLAHHEELSGAPPSIKTPGKL